MTNMPAEKICPRCSKKHTKRGQFCSASCGNVRVHSEEHKKHLANKLNQYNDTPEATARNARIARESRLRQQGVDFNPLTSEDFYIEIPDVKDYLDDYDDSWSRGSKW